MISTQLIIPDEFDGNTVLANHDNELYSYAYLLERIKKNEDSNSTKIKFHNPQVLCGGKKTKVANFRELTKK